MSTKRRNPITLKLNAGFSRKIGKPSFGSRGAIVYVELELDSNLIRDPDVRCDRIRNLFDLVRRIEELTLQEASSLIDKLKATTTNSSLDARCADLPAWHQDWHRNSARRRILVPLRAPDRSRAG
jgi:hypothetical protein